MPAIRFIEEDDKLNKFATVILTDGYCDNLDTSGLRKKLSYYFMWYKSKCI